MAFQQGLSGLNASAKALDVIGNNIANSGTVGFKGAQAKFSDVFAASLSGAGATNIGIGTAIGSVAQAFSQGTITATNNPLDLAINGNGFYRIEDPAGNVMWTRNGQYEVDKFGYIVTAQGNYLTGYQADDDGNITTGTTPAKIYLDPKPLSPAQTTEVNLSLNLDARKVAPSVAFDYTGNTLPPDPLSYNDSTSMTVYDTLGNPHVLSVYFITENTATTYSGIWDTAYTIDGINMTQGPKLPFTTSGALDTDTASANNFQTLNGVTFDPNAIPLDGSPGSTTLGFASSVVSAVPPETSDLALTFGTLPTLNLTGTSQYGAKFGINDQSQDGYTAGKLSSISVSPEGIVQGNYDNGNTRDIAQLALATFNNPNGLQSLGGNNWAETGASGQAQLGVPGSGKLGVIQSSAIEESNVDLTQELVFMINQQRAYQANAQTIKTQDQILSTLVNLR